MDDISTTTVKGGYRNTKGSIRCGMLPTTSSILSLAMHKYKAGMSGYRPELTPDENLDSKNDKKVHIVFLNKKSVVDWLTEITGISPAKWLYETKNPFNTSTINFEIEKWDSADVCWVNISIQRNNKFEWQLTLFGLAIIIGLLIFAIFVLHKVFFNLL